ncbi:MAG TPA: GNAT family N-acetyltransferase [Bacillota bacterium]|nr:GNAT family N-acetyltransferase [Bacillota bacterium]
MREDVEIRVVEKGDAAFLHSLYNNPDIMSYWFEEAYLSLQALEKSFDDNIDNEKSRQFIVMHDNEKIGLVELVGIDWKHRNAEFTIMIAPEHQGNGYARPATKLAIDYGFSTLNLHKLYLYVDKINEKAIHVYEKMGFEAEGVAKEMFFVNGTYHDAVVMGIFKRDVLRRDMN